MAPAPAPCRGVRPHGGGVARRRLRRRPSRAPRARRPRLPSASRGAHSRAPRRGAPPMLTTAPPERGPTPAAPVPRRLAPGAAAGAVGTATIASVGGVSAAHPAPAFPDADSTAWVAALGGTGPARDSAVERLHA